MNNQIAVNEKDAIVMKLLHYFITEKKYNPVILHGVQNEIWLENMQSDYKVIRIVSEYIHNDEQLGIDLFKTKRILQYIKRKTFQFNMNVLSIFLDLGENVSLEDKKVKNIDCVKLEVEEDIEKYPNVLEIFPDFLQKITFSEEGFELFLKISDDINECNKKEAAKIEAIFTPKKPIITYILIGIQVLLFLYGILFDKHMFLLSEYSVYGDAVRAGEWYRIITGGFLHVNAVHLVMNMYSLYILGSQAESFFGKVKFLIIYFGSMICASLLSCILNVDSLSVGASGAIFGLLGALLYFGYYFRVYLGNTLVKEVLPVIVLNLLLGFFLVNVDNFAHIGGLIGGAFITWSLGLKAKSENSDRINGLVLLTLYVLFLLYMNFIYF